MDKIYQYEPNLGEEEKQEWKDWLTNIKPQDFGKL